MTLKSLTRNIEAGSFGSALVGGGDEWCPCLRIYHKSLRLDYVFVFRSMRSVRDFAERNMDLEDVRREIEFMRVQIGRQRNEILQLQRAGISTASAELLLGRMHAKIDGLCEQRDRLKKEKPA